MSDSSPPRLLVVQKKFPQKIINEKMYIPTDFGPKKNMPKGDLFRYKKTIYEKL